MASVICFTIARLGGWRLGGECCCWEQYEYREEGKNPRENPRLPLASSVTYITDLLVAGSSVLGMAITLLSSLGRRSLSLTSQWRLYHRGRPPLF